VAGSDWRLARARASAGEGGAASTASSTEWHSSEQRGSERAGAGSWVVAREQRVSLWLVLVGGCHPSGSRQQAASSKQQAASERAARSAWHRGGWRAAAAVSSGGGQPAGCPPSPSRLSPLALTPSRPLALSPSRPLARSSSRPPAASGAAPAHAHPLHCAPHPPYPPQTPAACASQLRASPSLLLPPAAAACRLLAAPTGTGWCALRCPRCCPRPRNATLCAVKRRVLHAPPQRPIGRRNGFAENCGGLRRRRTAEGIRRLRGLRGRRRATAAWRSDRRPEGATTNMHTGSTTEQDES
jgi:hypothetical protein